MKKEKEDWRWGPLEFDGLFGLHGRFLCFHHMLDDTKAIVDPAKPIIPVDASDSTELPPFVERG